MDYSQIENREAFNELYWAAQPPEVRALRNMQPQERQSKAVELATKGFSVTRWIEFYGFEPWGTVKFLNDFGGGWLVPLLSTIQAVPNPTPGTGQISMFGPAPKGSITLNFDAAAYPPFDPPVQVEPVQAGFVPVGPCVYGNVYQGNFGDNRPVGTEWTDSRGVFVKKSAPSMFGPRMWWEKVG